MRAGERKPQTVIVVLIASVVGGIVVFNMVERCISIQSGAEQARIDSGTVVAPMNQDSQADEISNVAASEGEMLKSAHKLSQFEQSAYNYTIQDPYDDIMKNKLNYEEGAFAPGGLNANPSEGDLRTLNGGGDYPNANSYATLSMLPAPYSRARRAQVPMSIDQNGGPDNHLQLPAIDHGIRFTPV